MSEYTSTDEPTTMAADSFAGRSPRIQTIVRDAVLPQPQSLPVSLCRAAGAIASAHRDPSAASHSQSDTSTQDTATPHSRPVESILTPIETAVSYFEAYVRLRLDLLVTDRYPNTNPRARDAAILASDFLHAGAYAAVADAPLPDRRALELYRILTSASTRLSHQLLAVSQSRARSRGRGHGRDRTEGKTGSESGSTRSPRSRAVAATVASVPSVDSDGDTSSQPTPLVTLSETAAELGAVAAGASDTTRAAMRAYSSSLTAGLEIAAVGVGVAGAETGTGVGTDANGGAGTGDTGNDADVGTESAGDATAANPSPVADAVAVLSSGLMASREQDQTLSPSGEGLTLSFTDHEAAVTADVYRHYRLPSLSVDHVEGERDQTHNREPNRTRSYEQRRDDALEAARAALSALDDDSRDGHSEQDSIRTALEQATRVPVPDEVSAPVPSGAAGTEPTDDD
ncbi:hypothetical protein C482_07019 [Natrialba chahannaoensis JCM 10990]|uniref:Uncharacterized protein n=1 Tax=Natrialba chahannaoensis JCM 10990 TaxID=1227492 RepID=M0AS43_9EURY|nr:hypothetical protein [Natrialba chahannaoensis]ELZ01506.1 hypothetical protein C482_07019 [Natrialba chahannaoensis JCM 10990]